MKFDLHDNGGLPASGALSAWHGACETPWSVKQRHMARSFSRVAEEFGFRLLRATVVASQAIMLWALFLKIKPVSLGEGIHGVASGFNANTSEASLALHSGQFET
jgi:hypothetical protein